MSSHPQILVEWLNWALSKPLVLPRGYEPSNEVPRVHILEEDLRDGGAVLEVIMRLEQERRRSVPASDTNTSNTNTSGTHTHTSGTHSTNTAAHAGTPTKAEVAGVIEYKKRPKSEKFKLHNWEQVQHVLGLDTALQARELVAGEPGATKALVEQLIQRYSIRDSTHLRNTLCDMLTPHRTLDATINSAADTLSQDWHLASFADSLVWLVVLHQRAHDLVGDVTPFLAMNAEDRARHVIETLQQFKSIPSLVHKEHQLLNLEQELTLIDVQLIFALILQATEKSPVPISESEELTRQVQSQQEELQRLNDTLAALDQETHSTSQQLAGVNGQHQVPSKVTDDTQLQRLRAEQTRLQGELNSRREQVTQRQQELEQLREQLSRDQSALAERQREAEQLLTQKQARDAESKQLEEEIKALTENLQQDQSQEHVINEQVQRLRDELHGLEDQGREAEKRREELRSQIEGENSHAEELKQVSEQRARAQESVTRLREEQQQLEDSVQKQRDTLTGVKDQLATLEEELTRARGAVSSVEQGDLSALEEQKKTLVDQLEHKRSEERALVEELQTLKSRVEQLSGEREQLRSDQERALGERQRGAEQLSRDVEELTAQLTTAIEQVTLARDREQQLKSELQRLNEELTGVKQSAAHEEQELTAREGQLKTRQQELQTALAEQREQHTRLTHDIDARQSELTAAKDSAGHLTEQQSQVRELQSRVSELEQSLQDTTRQLDSETITCQTLQQRLTQLTEELRAGPGEELQRSIEREHQEQQRLGELKAQLLSQVEQKRQELHDTKLGNHQLSQQIETLLDQVAKVKLGTQQLQDDLQQEQLQSNKLREHVEQLHGQVQSLESELTQRIDTSVSATPEQVQRLEHDLQQLTGVKRTAEQSLLNERAVQQQLEHELKTAKHQVAELQTRVEDKNNLKNARKELNRVKKELEGKVKHEQTLIDGLQRDLQRELTATQRARRTNEELQTQISQLQEELQLRAEKIANLSAARDSAAQESSDWVSRADQIEQLQQQVHVQTTARVEEESRGVTLAEHEKGLREQLHDTRVKTPAKTPKKNVKQTPVKGSTSVKSPEVTPVKLSSVEQDAKAVTPIKQTPAKQVPNTDFVTPVKPRPAPAQTPLKTVVPPSTTKKRKSNTATLVSAEPVHEPMHHATSSQHSGTDWALVTVLGMVALVLILAGYNFVQMK